MDYQTWKLADGYWKGQIVSPVVKGSSREEVIEKLKNMTKENPEYYSLCDDCDPTSGMPLCNKCYGV
jgi:hypothetical protein